MDETATEAEGGDVAEVDDFLDAVLPRLTAADTALHNGDPAPRLAMWARNDPVTVFGALLTRSGWSEIAPAFEWLASRFSDCSSFEYEVIAAGASGDMGYVAGVEHTTASVNGAPPEAYELRVTTIFRREDGQWHVVHRHADPVPGDAPARAQLGRLGDD